MIIYFLSAVCNWFFLLFLIPFLGSLLPDIPTSRSSHSFSVPRGGGITFVALSSLVSLITFLSGSFTVFDILPLISLPLAVVGLLDDRFNLPAWFRYLVHFLTAFVLFYCSPLFRDLFLYNYSLGFLLILSVTLLVSITAVINFTNFMDGLDGLVAGCMSVAITALAIGINSSISLLVLVGSLLGFLLWNWSPAKVFMGDVGSTFLGSVFIGLVIQASGWIDLIGYLLIATPLLADAVFCVLRRLSSGQRVFQAHRLHLYQRLHQAGWPHSRVSSVYVASTALLALAMLCGGLPWVFGLSLLVLMLGVWLDQLVAVPFRVASGK